MDNIASQRLFEAVFVLFVTYTLVFTLILTRLHSILILETFGKI